MRKIFTDVLVSIIIANFIVPFILIIKNKNLSKKQKIKMLIRAFIVMGIITLLSLLFVLNRP
ncbi:MAG TPA: hypothetical protein PKW55_06525 [Spirochaetota bacterium]|nr:hypothetical protein [Spirochaetota bacterium]HOM38539.1 hypothetical protein [Spirochaetota bacterium]HPQ49079.1 hypothetical protein [Spirochaetota bacterium]